MNANKGMYIEQLVEKTIDYYLVNKLCFFEKRYLPIQIIKKISNDMIVGKLVKKSYVDYFGIWKGFYFSFETKQTSDEVFNLNQIKNHQLLHLSMVHHFNGISFVIIHFYSHDKTFLINYPTIEKWISNKKKKINIEFLTKNLINKGVYELILVFPGILNLLEQLKNLVVIN